MKTGREAAGVGNDLEAEGSGESHGIERADKLLFGLVTPSPARIAGFFYFIGNHIGDHIAEIANRVRRVKRGVVGILAGASCWHQWLPAESRSRWVLRFYTVENQHQDQQRSVDPW